MKLSDILRDKFGDETQHLCPNCLEATPLRTNAVSAWKAYLIGKSPVKPTKYHHYCSKCHNAQPDHSPLEGESARRGRQPAVAPVGGLHSTASV